MVIEKLNLSTVKLSHEMYKTFIKNCEKNNFIKYVNSDKNMKIKFTNEGSFILKNVINKIKFQNIDKLDWNFKTQALSLSPLNNKIDTYFDSYYYDNDIFEWEPLITHIKKIVIKRYKNNKHIDNYYIRQITNNK